MSGRKPEPRQPDEPSVEEILASIRRIVFAPGDGDPADPESRPAPDSRPGPEAPDDGAPAPEPPDPGPDGADLSRSEPEPERQSDPGSEDSRGDSRGDGRGDGQGAGPDSEPGDAVLLLTEMIAPDGSIVSLAPRPGAGEGAPDPADGQQSGAAGRRGEARQGRNPAVKQG